MSKKRLLDCRTDSDFLKYLEKTPGVEVEPGGRHFRVRNEVGSTVVSNHHKDLPPGTRHALLKQLHLMGIFCIVLAAMGITALILGTIVRIVLS